jgi:hypothetical protein
MLSRPDQPLVDAARYHQILAPINYDANHLQGTRPIKIIGRLGLY